MTTAPTGLPRDGRHALELVAAGHPLTLPLRHGRTVTVDRPTRLQRSYAQNYLDVDPLAALIGVHRGRPVVHGTLTRPLGPDDRDLASRTRHDTILTRGGDGIADLTPSMRDTGDSYVAVYAPPAADRPRAARGRTPGTLAVQLAEHDRRHGTGASADLGAALRDLARILDAPTTAADTAGAAQLAVARRLVDLASALGADLPAPITITADPGLPPGAPYDSVAVATPADASPTDPATILVVSGLTATDAAQLAAFLAGAGTP